MRAHNLAEDIAIHLRNYKVYSGVGIGNTPTNEIFVSGSIEASVAQPVQSATFNLHLGKGALSISPYLSTSLRNAAGDGPAVDIGQPIFLQTAVTPPGDDPAAYWRRVFTGYIDDISMDPTQ